MKFNITAGSALAFWVIIATLKAATPSRATPNPMARPRTRRGQLPRRGCFPDPNAPATKYDYHDAFGNRFFILKTVMKYARASDGQPGPKYWQNRADYQIAAKT